MAMSPKAVSPKHGVAIGLAVAVWIASTFGFSHGFWVVLGTLQVLRTSALGTGRTTVEAIAGGVLGYFIGAVLYDSVGLWVMKLYGLTDKVEAFREAYAQWGTWIILIKGMTPIPYKLVTIASGFAGYSFVMFVLLSLVARGMRFYLVAFLLNRYGVQARTIIEERLGFWVTVAAIALLGGIIAALYLF